MNTDKDLIDFLGIYRARTIPRQAYHYSVSTKAADELSRWPTTDVIDSAKGGGGKQLNCPPIGNRSRNFAITNRNNFPESPRGEISP